MNSYYCAECTHYECSKKEKGTLPKPCPMRDEDLMSSSFKEYEKDENKEFYVSSSEMEALGYCQWTRLREIMEFAKRMDYHRLGLAFCRGLRNEARITSRILRENGFDVISVICKTGGIDKDAIGIAHKVHPCEYEPMCNPIAQARFLEKAETEFNIVLGLCVGHDSMFFKYSHTLATVLAVKDRVTGHNPLAAIYNSEGYFKDRLKVEDGKA